MKKVYFDRVIFRFTLIEDACPKAFIVYTNELSLTWEFNERPGPRTIDVNEASLPRFANVLRIVKATQISFRDFQ